MVKLTQKIDWYWAIIFLLFTVFSSNFYIKIENMDFIMQMLNIFP